MSRLEKLIAELCPDGVEYKCLGDIAEIVRGNGLQKSDFTESGVGCIHYGQIYTKFGLFADKTLTYVSEELAGRLKKVHKGDLVVAITSENYEDICKCVVWLGDEDIVTGGHAAIVKHNQNAKYLAYCFNTLDFLKQKVKLAQGTKVMEISPERLARIKLPVPPLEVQREIVHILDDFSLYSNELAAELAARQKQYEYYRDSLLNFDKNDDSVKWMKLGEACKMIRGDYITKKDAVPGDIPVILGGKEPAYYINRANHQGEAIVVSRSGASAGFVSYWEEDIFVTDGFIIESTLQTELKYVYYFLKNTQDELNGMKRGGGVPHINGKMLGDFTIPVPSLAEQERIVAILDRFDKLCNDISEGLPAEIEMRRKQYEYYRDKLLTFKEKEV